MASSATVTVLFCDVVGSTERLVRLGDIVADEHRRELFAGLTEAVTRNGGEVVKHLGDGLMVVFPRSAVRALSCASDLHVAARAVDSDDPVQLRVGISAGEVTHEHDDWFGLPVVEAARLCGAAAPDQTLASAVIRHLVGSRAVDHRLTDVGAIPLKGLAAPLPTVQIDWLDDPFPAAAPVPPPAPAAIDNGEVDGPGRRRRSTTLAIAALLTVALVGGGLAWSTRGDGADGARAERSAAPPRRLSTPRGYRPVLRAADCSAEISDAAPGAVCRELIVPESRTNPGGPKVAVPVTSRYAEDPTADPVVLVDVNEPITTTSLVEVADVHALGLRGFAEGDRPALDCPELRTEWEATLGLRADDAGATSRRVDAARRCAERLRGEGVQLEGYDMAEVADDLRDLVIADDLAPVNVAGGGFATVAVTAFARSATDVVSSVLLTSPVSPGSSPIGDPVQSLQESFDRLIELCDDSPDCTASHPDLAATYRARFDQLEGAPEQVTTQSLVGTGPHQVLLDGRRWAAALEAALYSSDRLGLVPEAIDGASAELTASTGIDEDTRFFIAPAARAAATLSYMCSYDAHPNRTAEISASAAPQFAGANEASFAPICEAWDVPSEFDQLSRPLVGDVPVLLAQGGLSVSGANEWGEEMDAQLDRSTLVRFPTMSADVAYSPPPCLRRMRNDFLVDPASPVDVAACEEQSPEIDFVGN